MEKSSTSPVANAILNGDKRSCGHTLSGRGKGGEEKRRGKGERGEEFHRLGN